MMFKKGDVSVTFLVTLSLAIIVLIVVGLFFMGKAEWLIGKQEQTTSTVLSDATKNLAIEKCKLFCSLKNEESYNNPEFSKEVTDAGFTKCSDFEGLEAFDVQCRKCSGAAKETCSGKSQTECTGECSWDAENTKCKLSGTLKSCGDYKSNSECLRVSGCRWE